MHSHQVSKPTRPLSKMAFIWCLNQHNHQVSKPTRPLSKMASIWCLNQHTFTLSKVHAHDTLVSKLDQSALSKMQHLTKKKFVHAKLIGGCMDSIHWGIFLLWVVDVVDLTTYGCPVAPPATFPALWCCCRALSFLERATAITLFES